MSRNTSVIGLAVLVASTAFYSPLTHALQSGRYEGSISAMARQPVELSGVLAGLLAIAGLFIEGRRRTALARQLQHERDLNRRVWDAIEDGMVLVDTHSRVVEWNPAMERLTGLTRRQALGTALTSATGLEDPRHAECLRLALQGVETASDPAAFGRYDDTNGSTLRAYYSPRRCAEGHASGAFVLITSRARHAAVQQGERELEAPAA
jgi:PAS domain S-box-containing protein